MKLFQHPDFFDAITAAREYFNKAGLTEQLIEKDYYVTEALRIVASSYPFQVIFKGGTSLSKGWNIIQRFSEDIDLFLNRDSFTPRLGANRIDTELENLEKLVVNHPGLNLLEKEGRRKRGVYRHSYFSYSQKFSGLGAIAPRVFLETGTRSGTYPTQIVELSSYLAKFLSESGQTLSASDEASFPMQLLHFRRTFVEKLFTIHSKVIKCKQDGTSLGSAARHYYDMFCLAQQPEVQEMLHSEEYNLIKQDCARISLEHFKDELLPENLSFSNSESLFPSGELRQMIIKEYNQQSRNLCYEHYPTWEEVEASFRDLQELL